MCVCGCSLMFKKDKVKKKLEYKRTFKYNLRIC